MSTQPGTGLVGDPNRPDEVLWRGLQSFSVYRLLIAVLLGISYWGFHSLQVVGSATPLLSSATLVAYLALAMLMFITAGLRIPAPGMHLFAQVLVDVIGLTLLMHVSGGARSGIGLLLLVTLAAAGRVSRGRMAFFHAALAALAVLLEQTWQVMTMAAPGSEFVPAGLLAGSFFVLSGLSHSFATYATRAEKIAEARGLDLANLGQINELVIRDMQDGFVVVDESGLIRQHNPQSVSLVAALANSTNKPLAEVAPRLGGVLAQWRTDRTRAFRSHAFPIISDEDTHREYQVRLVNIGDQEPSPTVIFLEDAGRIRSQAQQMKLVALGRLTASIAHEIRNPLSSINHAAELLQEDADRSPADTRLLSIIRDNALRLDRMVQEVLYLNRRDRAQPQPIDGAAYLQQFVEDFCSNEKIALDTISCAVTTTRRVLFDPGHLDQILWNIVRNAHRHGRHQPGSVRIQLADARVPDLAELTVSDDGPGVPLEARAQLFEPFFTTESEGTGLGLYIARELAEGNGAQIECLAPVTQPALQQPQRGAVFCITMMAIAPDQARRKHSTGHSA